MTDAMTIIQVEPISVSVENAAKAIGCSERQMWRILSQGEIETRKLGGRTLVLFESLRTYIQALPVT